MPTRSNIVLVTVDCLRADRLGCYGYDGPTTPYLDRFARRATLFRQAIASGPSTAYSFPAILTSTAPFMHGGPFKLSENHVTIGEILQDAGYETAAFHSNPYLAEDSDHNRGFDHFRDSMDSGEGATCGSPDWRETWRYMAELCADKIRVWLGDSWIHRWGRRAMRAYNLVGGQAAYTPCDELNRQVFDFLGKTRRPFFLWVHYMDVHYPYTVKENLLRPFLSGFLSPVKNLQLHLNMVEEPDELSRGDLRIIQALYNASLRYVDGCIKRLFERLQAEGFWDETTVFVSADHGEQFREHSTYGHLTSRGPNLWDELLRVPLLVRCPERGGQEIPTQVGLIDLPPTMADLAGVPSADSWCGQTLLPLMNGTGGHSPCVLAEHFVHTGKGKRERVFCGRGHHWKLIYREWENSYSAYDLQNDPRETRDVYPVSNKAVRELRSEIHRHIEQLDDSQKRDSDLPGDKEVQRRLRALGYMQ